MPKPEPANFKTLEVEHSEQARKVAEKELAKLPPETELIRQQFEQATADFIIKNEKPIFADAEHTPPVIIKEAQNMVSIGDLLKSEPALAETIFDDEPSELEIEFDVAEELTIEIPEVTDEGLLVIEHEAPVYELAAEESELEEFALPAQEIEDEINKAAILWAEGQAVESTAEPQEQDIPDEAPEPPVTIIELLPIEPEELVEKLQSIPEKRLEEAAAILEVILQTAERVEQNDEVGETDLELVVAGLEQMVERLLVCLEIEHDEKHVAAIVQALLNGEIKLDFEDVLARQDEGTHERKYVSAWIMAVLKQRTTPSAPDHTFIGKYVMQLSFSDTQLNWAA